MLPIIGGDAGKNREIGLFQGIQFLKNNQNLALLKPEKDLRLKKQGETLCQIKTYPVLEDDSIILV
jgi:hypothetical protein